MRKANLSNLNEPLAPQINDYLNTEVEQFRNRVREELVRLQRSGNLEDATETLDILSAILAHHMAKAARVNRH